ncbi:MAG: nucleotidyltransferase domain-containing protein [Rhodoferax sp.]|uniref:nucleotidyltransferase family protein n=1 Tax=Rhodoferax sp. TaxID=50421 RepID=UPI00301952DF
MRLSPQQIEIILATSHEVMGADASVWLYGSRLDDQRQGGDIDLLVEVAPAHGLLCRARLKTRLEQRLQLPVDVLLARRGMAGGAFVAIARAQAQPLWAASAPS